METSTCRVYELTAFQLDDARRRLEKANRRKSKLDKPALEIKVVKVEDEILTHPDTGEKIPVTYFHSVLEGQTASVDGTWALLGTLESFSAGTLFNAVPWLDKNDPAIRVWSAKGVDALTCDHCSYNPRRKKTIVVRNKETGEMKQVGTTCVKDYFPIDADIILALAKWADKSQKIMEESEDSMIRSRPVFTPFELASMTAAVIDTAGWISKGKAYEKDLQSTCDIVLGLIYGSKSTWNEIRFLNPNFKIEESHKERARKALDWAKVDPYAVPAGYLRNLAIVCAEMYVYDKQAGLICSVISAYDRAMQKEAEKKETVNEYFGTVGKRETFKVLVKWTKDIDSDYGFKRLIVMEAENGASIKWFGTGDLAHEMERGKVYEVKATIKKHGEYNGRKETLVNRVKPA